MKELILKSPAFENNTQIPAKYTCDGKDISPPLTIERLPKETKSMALIVDDPDAPMGIWDHWIVWNIAPTTKIEENQVPGSEGTNSFRKQSYGGPCPPSGTHRYFFKIYALDTLLNLKPSSQKKDLEKAMQDHIIAQGQLVGLYHRTT
jgi:Raf kinase inhibitor-like YbhB/YbcL family protein